MTNADKIRSMSDEELADFLNEMNLSDSCIPEDQLMVDCAGDCPACWRIWLKNIYEE